MRNVKKWKQKLLKRDFIGMIRLENSFQIYQIVQIQYTFLYAVQIHPIRMTNENVKHEISLHWHHNKTIHDWDDRKSWEEKSMCLVKNYQCNTQRLTNPRINEQLTLVMFHFKYAQLLYQFWSWQSINKIISDILMTVQSFGLVLNKFSHIQCDEHWIDWYTDEGV